MISRSGLRPFWKSIFLLATLAAGVLPAVAQQQTEAQFEASVYSAIQPLLSQAPGSPIIMSSNVVLAQGAFIVSSAVTVQVLENYVDGLKAAGAQRVDINPGYLSLSNPAIMAKYDALVLHIRQLGLQLAINPEFTADQIYVPGQQGVNSFQQFQTPALAGLQQIAARYKPDNLVIVHEPDTMNNRMALRSNTVGDWDGFIRAAAPLIRQVSPRTRLGAGCYYGIFVSTEASENAYFQDFAGIPALDFLTMDIYNDDTFSQYAQWASLAHANGKSAYIEETWIPHYFASGVVPQPTPTQDLDELATIGPNSADFAQANINGTTVNLFAQWLHALSLFASANNMEAITPFDDPAFFQYGGPGADTVTNGAYDQIVESAITQGQLTPTAQSYLTDAQQLGAKMATSLSNASYATFSTIFNPKCGTATNPCNANSTVSPDALISTFGTDLANTTAVSLSFPTTLGGTTATLVDSTNTSYPVPLYSVAATQVNYVVPSGAQPGPATLTITSGDGTKTTGIVYVAPVAPGLYSANADGKGPAAAIAVCAGTCAGWPTAGKANGQFFQTTFTCPNGAGSCETQPISIADGDTVFVELYGTGLRHLASLSSVSMQINGQNVPVANVQYVGAQGADKGLDQINVHIPSSLAGSGEVNVVLAMPDTADGITVTSNTVTLNFK
jgi:uncharacterized protein (TIGR03437 family)